MIAIGVGVDPVRVNRAERRAVPADGLMPGDAARRCRLVRQSAGEVRRDAEEGAGFGVAEPSDDVRGGPEQVLVAVSEVLLRWGCAVVDADRLIEVIDQRGFAGRV